VNDAADLDKPRVQSMIVDLFHSLYYDSPHTWRSRGSDLLTSFFGGEGNWDAISYLR
jgi:hypothetical protein